MRNVVKAVLGLLTGSREKRKNGLVAGQELPQSILQQLDVARFEKMIGWRPKNWRLFIEALLHRSYIPQLDQSWRSNERLEFLGDAVLSFIVAEYLITEHPGMEEGDLTKLRSRLVNRRILAQQARELHLSDFLLLSSSAAQSIDQGSESILSDAFEAIIGAMYLDAGIDGAREFVHRSLLGSKTLESALTDDNYKSAFLEHAQAAGSGIPRYVIVREEGPDHDRRFTIEVYIGTEMWGVGNGRSKKEAEQAAAAQALDRIQEQTNRP
ncbi:MAG: ribonuclease III [Bacteroidota bacterium]